MANYDTNVPESMYNETCDTLGHLLEDRGCDIHSIAYTGNGNYTVHLMPESDMYISDLDSLYGESGFLVKSIRDHIVQFNKY